MNDGGAGKTGDGHERISDGLEGEETLGALLATLGKKLWGMQ
jgi:hypothetical protein